MPTRLPKANSDVNAWIALNNLFNVNNMGNEYIKIELNANNPPTIKQYTRALFYATDTGYTIAVSPATGNNEYGAGDNITYLTSEAIYEDSADVTFTWAGTVRGETIATQSDGTWYILLKGSVDTDETTIGQGKYNFSKTETPTWNNVKGGWYSSGGYKVLGSFDSATGTVSELVVYQSDAVIHSTIDPAITPGRIGQIYMNITTGVTYISDGTAAASDWININGILSGAGAPSATPDYLGQRYVDTTAKRWYCATGTSSSADWDKEAVYASGTETVTGGSGDVTVTLPWDWSGGFLILHLSVASANYFNINSVGDNNILKHETSYEALTSGTYTDGQILIHRRRDVNPPENYENAKTNNASGLPKSATSTSFTLDDDGSITTYAKWFVWA